MSWIHTNIQQSLPNPLITKGDLWFFILRDLSNPTEDIGINMKIEKKVRLTEQVPLRKDSRFRHTGTRINMLLKFKQRAEARATANAV